MTVIAISGCFPENGMASGEYGDYDGPMVKRIQPRNYKNFHSLYPNLALFPDRWNSHRVAFKPLFYSGYKSPQRIGTQDNERSPSNTEMGESEAPDSLSSREDKRNKQPKKSGESGKDDFDSNSYFMLRPLRRLPMEQYDGQKMSNILGMSTKIIKFYSQFHFYFILMFIYICKYTFLITGQEPIWNGFRYHA